MRSWVVWDLAAGRPPPPAVHALPFCWLACKGCSPPSLLLTLRALLDLSTPFRSFPDRPAAALIFARRARRRRAVFLTVLIVIPL
jgi:hypothetical protein